MERRGWWLAAVALVIALTGTATVLRHAPARSTASVEVTAHDEPIPDPTPAPDPSPTPQAAPEPTPAPAPSPSADAASGEARPEASPSPRTAYLPPGLEVHIKAAPADARPGEMVVFTAGMSDTDGSLRSYEYDFGDGTAYRPLPPLARCDGRPVEYQPNYRGQPSERSLDYQRGFRRAGTFVVRLTVRSWGNCNTELPAETASATVTVRVADGPPVSNGPHAPVVEAGYGQIDADGNRGLWWSARDADGWISRIVVDPGDGRDPIEIDVADPSSCADTESGWPESRRWSDREVDYPAPGRYEGTVTVTTTGCDDGSEQTASASYVADVANSAPAPSPSPSPAPDADTAGAEVAA